MLDLAIIGGGPAALSAAVYASRAGLKAEVFERKNLGGTLMEIDHIANYPGFLGAGKDLGENFRTSATEAGAKLSYGECTEVKIGKDGFGLKIDGEDVAAKSVLIATGSEPRPLDFPLEKPVSYCALCDGDLIKGKKIAVVGGANSALQEAIYLANLAESVTVITHSTLKADAKLKEQLAEHGNIKVQENTEPTKDLLETYDHAFVYIGRRPASSCVDGLADLAKDGTILTGNDHNFPHETNVSGLFAAGDVRYNAIRQVITATADGAVAAMEIVDWLKEK